MTDLTASTPTPGRKTAEPAVMTRRALVRNTALAGGGTVMAMLLTGCADEKPAAPQGEPFDVPVSEVPVGSGVVLPSHDVIITQPEAGKFLAFSAICTHKGCPVSEIREQGAFCGCHSSYFDIATGEAVSGPAQQPLTQLTVTQQGDSLRVTP